MVPQVNFKIFLKKFSESFSHKAKIFSVAMFIVCMLYSFTSQKDYKFKFNKNYSCNGINPKQNYTTDNLFYLLVDSAFLKAQKKKSQDCFIEIVSKLSSPKLYKPHYICDFIGCSYGSVRVTDSAAYLLRFDIKKLMTLYNFKDSTIFLEKYCLKFKKYDSLMIAKHALQYRLQPNLEPDIFDE